MSSVDVTLRARPSVSVGAGNICYPATYTLVNTATPPATLDSGTIAAGGSETIVAPPASWSLENTDGDPLDSGTIPSNESALITAPDADVTINSAPFGTAPSGGSLNVPVIQNGSPVGAKVGSDWVIPPCADATFSIDGTQVDTIGSGADLDVRVELNGSPVTPTYNIGTKVIGVNAQVGGSVSVAVSNATPAFGSTFTITATPTGFIPVRYFCEIRQGSILRFVGDNGTGIFNYTADFVGAVEVFVYADDGTTVSAFNIGGTAAVVAFTPLSLASPVAGYDASDASTVTIATGVAAIANKVGGGQALVQASGTAQPSYVLAYQNGLNAIKFDGSNDFLATGAALLSGNDWYVSVACRPVVAGQIQSIFGQFGSGQDGRMTINANQNIGGGVSSGRMNPFISPATGLTDFAFTTGNHVIEFESALGVLQVRFNGTVVATGTTAVSVFATIFRVGSLDGASLFFSGHFYEMWCYNASQTTANKNALLSYYQIKWGI
jgi:hypothetical protein